MIRASSLTATPDSAYAVAPSRTADKFGLRIPEALYLALCELSRGHYRSFNNEVVQGLLSYLEGHRKILTLRQILIDRLGAELADPIVAGVSRLPHIDKDRAGYPVRLPEGLRAEIQDHAKVNATIMREVTATACADWVLYSQQLEALLAACEAEEGSFPLARMAS